MDLRVTNTEHLADLVYLTVHGHWVKLDKRPNDETITESLAAILTAVASLISAHSDPELCMDYIRAFTNDSEVRRNIAQTSHQYLKRLRETGIL